MADDKLSQHLMELKPSGTFTADLIRYWPLIEERIAAGVSHEEILKTLQAEGFDDLTLGTFRKTIYRFRRKHGDEHVDGWHGYIRDQLKGSRAHAFIESVKSEKPPADGNQQVKGEVSQTEETSTTEQVSLDAALDPALRDKLTDKYLQARPRILGKKKPGSN